MTASELLGVLKGLPGDMPVAGYDGECGFYLVRYAVRIIIAHDNTRKAVLVLSPHPDPESPADNPHLYREILGSATSGEELYGRPAILDPGQWPGIRIRLQKPGINTDRPEDWRAMAQGPDGNFIDAYAATEDEAVAYLRREIAARAETERSLR